MKQVYRVLYPILIYNIIMVLVALLLPSLGGLAGTMISALLTIPILGCFFNKDQVMRRQRLFHHGINLKVACFIGLFGIGTCITINNLIDLSRLPLLFRGFLEVSEALYSPPVWLQFLSMVLVIPVAEELVFRALGFKRIRDTHGFWFAAVFSSLLFAVFHGNVIQGLYAFILGLCMCWVYERTGSILSTILFHQSANLVSVVLTNVEFYGIFKTTGSFFILTLAGLVIWVGSYNLLKKSIQKEVRT